MPRPTILNEQGQIILNAGSVQLLPYKERPFIQRQFMTDDEIMKHVGTDLILDTESFPNYFMCGFKHNLTNKFIMIERDFNPNFLAWLLYNYRTVGFKSLTYDLVMLWASYINRDPEYLKDVSNALIVRGMRTKEVEKEFGFKVFKTPHIDLIEVCPLKGSLKLYGARLHAPRLQDLPYPDTKELTQNEINIVCNYNFNDLDLTQLIYNFNKDRLDLRASMGIEYNEDLMSKSDAQIAEAVISKEVGKALKRYIKRPDIEAGTTYKYEVPKYIRFSTPELQKMLGAIRKADFIVSDSGKIILPEELKIAVKINQGVYRLGIGGLHSSEENISHKSNDKFMLIDRDVASYYPRIITTLGLCPISMGNAFQDVFIKIIDRRLHAKKNKIFATDKGLKIVINGTSGKFSDFWSTMYSPDLTIQMTLTGQLALLMQIDIMESNGIQAISANTDGVVYYCARNKYELFLKLIKFWEIETGFETEETLYSGYYARDVNAYFACKLDAKSVKDVKVKGSYSEVGSQSGTQLDNNPVTLICSDAIKQLLVDGTPIEKTIRECRDITRFIAVRNVKGGAHKEREYLGKVVRWYYAQGAQGAIHYVLTNNRVADTEGAKPLQDLPESFPDDIDYERYLSITKDILYDIGYYYRPKQVTFF